MALQTTKANTAHEPLATALLAHLSFLLEEANSVSPGVEKHRLLELFISRGWGTGQG